MSQINRRSGLSLVFAGIAGIGFFWATDPRYGIARHWVGMADLVDEATRQFPGTIVGLIASVMVLIIGIYLFSRRAV